MIAAGKDKIKEWFIKGKNGGHKYMLIIYDRMGYPDDSDYPAYAGSAEEAREKMREVGRSELSEVMEAYDLTADMDEQLAEKRAWNIPKAPEGAKTFSAIEKLSCGKSRLEFMRDTNEGYIKEHFSGRDDVTEREMRVFCDSGEIYSVCVYLIESAETPLLTAATVYRFAPDGGVEPVFLMINQSYDPRLPLDHDVSVSEPETDAGTLYVTFSLRYATDMKDRDTSAYKLYFYSKTYVSRNLGSFYSENFDFSIHTDDESHEIYERGLKLLDGGEGDKAMPLFLEAAGNGHVDALYTVGKLLFMSEGIFTEHPGRRRSMIIEEGMRWFKKAAILGHTMAALMIAHGYDEGFDLPKNPEKALYWFKRAAKGADAIPDGEEPFEKLSRMYWRGEGCERSFERAMDWAVKAARNEKRLLSRAKQIQMGDWPAEGIYEYACLEAAHESGEAWAEALMEAMFSEGKLDRDEVERQWTAPRKADIADDDMFDTVVNEKEKIRKWAEEYEPDADYLAPYGMKKFADRYRTGSGDFSKNPILAVYWYKKTEVRGLMRNDCEESLKEIKELYPDAYAKGLKLYEADIWERRYLRSLKWAEDDLWYDGGSTAKGSHITYHDPHPVRYETSADGRWDGRTAEDDILAGCEAIKACDYEKCIFHMERAARGGMASAQYLMGLYCTDYGMMKGDPDFVRAEYWLKKAAAQGHEKAAEKLSGDDLHCLNIPNNVKFIGKHAFYEFPSITGVKFAPDGVLVEEIEKCAFAMCWKLKEVIIPKGPVKLGFGAFFGCTVLKTVRLGPGAVSIGSMAFLCCPALEDLFIPESVMDIHDNAFSLPGTDPLPPNLTIWGTHGSMAEDYAQRKGIAFRNFA